MKNVFSERLKIFSGFEQKIAVSFFQVVSGLQIFPGEWGPCRGKKLNGKKTVFFFICITQNETSATINS